jgi:hypothetical protein
LGRAGAARPSRPARPVAPPGPPTRPSGPLLTPAAVEVVRDVIAGSPCLAAATATTRRGCACCLVATSLCGRHTRYLRVCSWGSAGDPGGHRAGAGRRSRPMGAGAGAAYCPEAASRRLRATGAELDWTPVVTGMLVGIHLVGRDPPIHRGLRGRRGSGAGATNLYVKSMTAASRPRWSTCSGPPWARGWSGKARPEPPSSGHRSLVTSPCPQPAGSAVSTTREN